MADIRQYLLSVISAALLCAILDGILGKKGTLGAVTKLVCGIFMMLTIVGPWANIRLDGFLDTVDGLSLDGEMVSAQASAEARESMAAVIKEQTEAYILDKAKSMGVQLTVEVSLDGSDVPLPVGVTISGSISPYGKRKLTEIISQDLGIEAEEQIWIG